jgi:transcriptional regulator of acetoin/glycerol metabolism
MTTQCLREPLITMQSLDFPWVSDRILLRSLTMAPSRPSLLVMCDDIEPDAAIASLMKWCEQPFHICALPGPLELPALRKGTLFIKDVSRMTLAQQIALNDWIDRGRGDMQIVSASETRLWPLVEAGQFLESLFYRLNLITLEAKAPRKIAIA